MPRLPLHLFRALRTVQAQAHHLPFLNHHAAVIPATRLSFLATRPPPMSLGSLLPMANGPTFTPASVQVRHKARGNEYQPSQRVRKRRHGFLARQRSVGGRKILARRKAKQRRFLSH